MCNLNLIVRRQSGRVKLWDGTASRLSVSWKTKSRAVVLEQRRFKGHDHYTQHGVLDCHPDLSGLTREDVTGLWIRIMEQIISIKFLSMKRVFWGCRSMSLFLGATWGRVMISACAYLHRSGYGGRVCVCREEGGREGKANGAKCCPNPNQQQQTPFT